VQCPADEGVRSARAKEGDPREARLNARPAEIQPPQGGPGCGWPPRRPAALATPARGSRVAEPGWGQSGGHGGVHAARRGPLVRRAGRNGLRIGHRVSCVRWRTREPVAFIRIHTIPSRLLMSHVWLRKTGSRFCTTCLWPAANTHRIVDILMPCAPDAHPGHRRSRAHVHRYGQAQAPARRDAGVLSRREPLHRSRALMTSPARRGVGSAPPPFRERASLASALPVPRQTERQIYFISRYSSIPWREPSRPRPDCLTPPNGATSVEMMPVFTPTIPYSSASDTRVTRPRSRA